LKITQIARRFTPRSWGGTETVVLETGRRLLAAGHETHVVTTNALDDRPSERIRGLSVQRVPYFYPYLGLDREAKEALDMKAGNMFSFALMRKLMRDPAPDVYHLHTGKRIGGIVRTVARRRGVPYVVTLHGGFADVPADERARWTEPTQGALEWGRLLGWLVGSRRVLQDAAAVICVGENEAEALRARIPGAHVIHLPNGVDTERFQKGDGDAFRERFGIPRDRRLILTLGRIDRQKNQRLAVRTLERVLAGDPDAHLLMVGHVTDPEYRAQVEEDVRRLGLESRVTLIPGLQAESEELSGAFHASDVFLLPSVHEPFGVVVVEAWAAGLPVVASRVGGIPGFAEHGRDVLFFESGSADEAAAALLELLSDRARADELAARGRAKALNRYSWDRITDDLVDIYRDVTLSAGAGTSSPPGRTLGEAA
jgi:glycosyltransferase involved in cell wall biosynthesis